MLRLLAAKYRAWSLDRYDRYSKGGGNWPPLSPRTIAQRRKGKGSGPATVILVDTGLLKGALNIRFSHAPGQLEKDIPGGIRVGYGGPSRHPNGGRSTIADIASFHQNGGGRLPKREIIVVPNKTFMNDAVKDIEAEMSKLA